jgi:hypothetical protein
VNLQHVNVKHPWSCDGILLGCGTRLEPPVESSLTLLLPPTPSILFKRCVVLYISSIYLVPSLSLDLFYLAIMALSNGAQPDARWDETQCKEALAQLERVQEHVSNHARS